MHMENIEDRNVMESGECVRQFSRIRSQVASAIRQTADALSLPREAQSESGELKHIGMQARGWIEGAADQIEKIDPVKMKKDFTECVQRNPGTSLLTAAAVGLIFGIAVVRRR
jgi:ElaB/YqjD/DUF883 family membrane-anchored ribosome-binding protein